jgi:hypothetical protein
MTLSKLSMIAGFIIAFTLIFELTAHANDDNQLTKLTFSEAVQVPGQILPAGTYEFVLADSQTGGNRVRIFNADGTRFIASVQTVSAERSRETNETSITLAQRPDGQPDALMTWFYPGMDTGHEFIYSKPVETELAQDAKQTFLVGDHGTMVTPEANGGGN